MQFHFSPAMGADIHAYAQRPKTEGFTLLPTLLRPKSRGYVGLHSNKPTDAPLIDPQYLSDTGGEDLATLLRGVKKARQVPLSNAFKPYRVNDQLNYPQNAQTDDELKQHILTALETVYHPCGTCKMGVDDMAVVSPENLQARVCRASAW